MVHKNYDSMILKRIEKSFDKLMPIGSLVAFFSAFAIYFSAIPKRFVVFDTLIGLIFFFLYIFSDKLQVETKMIVAISIPIIIGVLSFADGGFASAGVTLIMLSNAIATLFLSKKKSTIVGLASFVLMVLLWLYTLKYPINLSGDINTSIWIVQLSTFGLYLLILKNVAFAIRKYLLENILELEVSVEETYKLAFIDQLTGLSNLNLFKAQLKDKILNGVDQGYIVIVSLSNLNVVNSIHTEMTGDLVLKLTARILQALKEDDVLIARVGGNEFVIWVENVDTQALIHRMRYYRTYFNDHFKIEHMTMEIQFSSGYGQYHRGTTLEACYQKAGLALTYAKANGIHSLLGYDDKLDQAIRYEERIKEALSKALVSDEFVLYYQSKIDVINHRVVGVEALARWQSEDLGLISPAVFIPIIEKVQRARQFGELIIDKAIGSYHKLCEKYEEDLVLSINISPSHLITDGFVEYVASCLKKHRVPAKRIILEITEEVMIQQFDIIMTIISALKKIGLMISLDDFGSGYSSFSYLTVLDIDEIKIDKFFIDQIESNEKVSFLLKMLIQLSKEYQLNIIAEGVETQAQSDHLLKLGCRVIQGYLYSRPEPLNNG